MHDPKKICDSVRSEDGKIRHAGYHDEFGRILYDNRRENTPPLEGREEQSLLNGRVSSMLSMWRTADSVVGKIEGFVMVREKLTALIVPDGEKNYFLVVFDPGTSLESVDKTRLKLLRESIS